MKESLLIPREKAFVGMLANLGSKAFKAAKTGASKLDDSLEELLNKVQGVTPKTPGTKKNSAIIGEERVDAFGNAKVIKGGLYTGLTTAGLNFIAGLFEEDTSPSDLSIISTAKADSKKIYTPSELPTEGAASIEGDGFFIYKNKDLKNAAIAASMNDEPTFKFSGNGQEYETKRMLNTFSLLEDRTKKAEGGKFPDLNKDGKTTYADVLKGRGAFQEGGSMLMPPEMEPEMPVDTYDNIPPEEMDEAMASQLPDKEMEDKYTDFILKEALPPEDQEYLMSALQEDNRLSSIFDKIMDVAGEFSGEGEVDGPGTGVSDSIPARLSDGEFVFTKKATDQIGAEQLQTMMDDAERAYDGGQMQQMAFGGMLTNDPMQDEKQKDYMEGLLNTEDAIKQQMIRANRTPSVYANLR